MYKTVRKGDASLQYTILPQTDQFSSSGFPPAAGKPRPLIVRYTMAALMVLIILSFVATPFLMNQNDRNLFAGTMLAMGRVGHSAPFEHRDAAGRPCEPASASTTEQAARKDLVLDPTTDTADALGTETQRDLEDSATVPDAAADDDDDSRRVQLSTETWTSARQTRASVAPSTARQTSSSTSTSTMTSSTPSTATTTTAFGQSEKSSSSATESLAAASPAPSATASGSGGSTEASRAASSGPRKGQMPRVTLKLRENETIPQMYMKAGIASYKKGNITTSVLAHGLSLEGLIFKTPEGTIKPWPQKWFFTDPSSDFQWKGSNQVPVTIYVVLAGLAVLASISIVLMFYVQRKASRRQRPCVEEPEAEGPEEDKSTLLGAGGRKTEETETEETEAETE